MARENEIWQRVAINNDTRPESPNNWACFKLLLLTTDLKRPLADITTTHNAGPTIGPASNYYY